MFKWDRISWWATGISLTGLLLGIFVHELFLYLMIGSLLLRSTLLAFNAAKKYADERQMLIQYHSGNIAFTFVIVAIILYSLKAELSGQTVDTFATLLIIGLGTKAAVGLVMVGDYRVAAVRIAVTIGLALIIFASLSHGLSISTLIESAPGLLILITGLVGIKRPLVSAIILAIIGLATFVMFGPVGGLTESRIFMGIVLSLPLFVTAVCFYKSTKIGKS